MGEFTEYDNCDLTIIAEHVEGESAEDAARADRAIAELERRADATTLTMYGRRRCQDALARAAAVLGE